MLAYKLKLLIEIEFRSTLQRLFMKKTMTFAIMHFAVAFTVAYLLTGSMVVGGLVALVEPAINTVAFYFHELVWKKLEDKKARENIAPTLSAF